MNDEDARIRLGNRIRTLRKSKGWTQQELGARSDTSYKYLGEVERGAQNISVDVLVKIAAALEVQPVELFRFAPEMPDPKKMRLRIKGTIDSLSDEDVRKLYAVLHVLFPDR